MWRLTKGALKKVYEVVELSYYSDMVGVNGDIYSRRAYYLKMCVCVCVWWVEIFFHYKSS